MQVGENGVGLKQAMFHLCGSGLAISRNGPTVGVAFLSRALNKELTEQKLITGPTIPSFEITRVRTNQASCRSGPGWN